MQAQIISHQTPAVRRTMLGTVLPLSTPYLVQVFPVYACNFKCNYCVLSVPKSERGYISDLKTLDFTLYKKCIDDLKQFPQKLRMLRFAGTGEPLLHEQLPEMIAYAVEANISESIDIVTNGALLLPELANRLVEGGVSRIRVSIQGVNPEQYRQTTQVYEDYQKIVENVAYLYSIKGNVEVYVKIIDSALDSEQDKQAFYSQFGDIADFVSVEHLLPATPLIDYDKVRGKALMDKTQNGMAVASTDICPQPFYMLQINPDGVVVPCCGMESPLKIDQLVNVSLLDIWHSKALNLFRQQMLTGRRSNNRVCAQCNQFRFAMFPEDVLDAYASDLLSAYAD